MSSKIQVLDENDLESIIEFEKRILKQNVANEMDQEIFSWSAPWRKESLIHYIHYGWSFSYKNENELLAYFLAQPLLFLDGQTQSLWVEHLSSITEQSKTEIIAFAVKLCKEKHLQKIYLPKNVESKMTDYNFQSWEPAWLQIRTTRT